MWWILVIIIIAVVVMGSENIKKMNRNDGKNKLHHMHVSNMPKLHMCHIALMERNLHWFIK